MDISETEHGWITIILPFLMAIDMGNIQDI